MISSNLSKNEVFLLKTIACFFIFFTIISWYANSTQAQVICINCYNQNDSISTNINNLIVNGSFENTTCPLTTYTTYSGSFCPASGTYNCSIVNWTCTGGGVNTYVCFLDSNQSYVCTGSHSPYFGNYYCRCCDTSYPASVVCLLDSGCIVKGIKSGYPKPYSGQGDSTGVSLEQTVSGLTVGDVYVLEFWAGGECDSGANFISAGLFAVDIGFGKIYLRCLPTQPHTGVGTRYVIQFKATSSTHTFKFTNWGHISLGYTELILDDVRLYTLAELANIVPHCFISQSHTVSYCPGDSAILSISASATNISWLPTTNLSCSNCYNPVCHSTSTTVYVANSRQAGIMVSDTFIVKVNCKPIDTTPPPINPGSTLLPDCGSIKAPNAFSPDGDGNNDIFYPIYLNGATLEYFKIYNRWGELVFETNDSKAGWDGNYKGAKQPLDVYVFTIKVKCDSYSIKPIKGNVTLIR